ncbi:LacI family transcriptional regulator [Paenibacillus sp. FSL A5-0031]|uniref:substrate-binding domain-containing protein n=1 Tax=Paenibacillus sp. FSL A5-0031 TaxID=1920420 RepID=UPI00096D1245|nr:substrate-binding domain-containing protein [Paenibacillus sp. FSL A5-0031]OME77400.1 LacI family transcriptional regulator [Paenibacillus sp. FSL A5-0031]
MAGSHKWVTTAVALLLIAVAVFVYGHNGLSAKKKIEVTVILKTIDTSVEFWQVLIDGVHEAAQEFNVNVQVWGTKSETDVDEQIALVEKAILNKPDAIVLAATDYERLVPVAEKIKKNGIKLIIVDSGIKSDAADSIVTTDNVSAGREAGEAMKSLIKDKAKIAIISYVKSAASHIDREKGVHEVLENYPGIEMLGTYNGEGSEQNSYLLAMEMLQQHNDVFGIIGLNEPTTVGAGRAIQELGLKGKVQLIGFDSSFNEIKLLDEGVMNATVLQRPFQMGYLSIKTAMEVVKGKKAAKLIDTGSLLITKKNMYEEENQKLLFPFVGNE